ncbi:hypothetical protein ED208_03005 [Stagnimonas aquatica]|uniref:Uncharacterized protein n=1 Tax=Stagnimonas aquatica TaxID=2689987 RepID=A0A3N0VL58_9GAMM|nr:hypothetical protein ED208_03005 [Stagnimonas aquatica]
MKVVIVALVLLVGLMFAYQYGKPPPTSPSLPPAAEPAPTSPVAPSVVNSPAQPVPPPSVPSGPSASEWSRLESLRDYCQRMTRMNAGGEYPSLQRSACGDYARYAQLHGFGAVALPEVLEMVPGSSKPATAWTAQRAPTLVPRPPLECERLEDLKQQINAATRQAHSGWQAERYREELRRINARMWDLNCRNH